MASPALEHLRASLAGRTRFFDDQVTAAIAAGLRQVVVLGAGYDDRALRFRSPGVTFFELDQPATQADKQARLHAILAEDDCPLPLPVLAAADFTSDDVAGVLAGSGHDPALPTLFLCEGLLVYLDQASTVRFLASVRGAAAAGSVLAASRGIHADGLDSAAVVARGNARRRTAGAEPWQTILPAGGQSDLLARAGWRIVAAVDAADLGTGADPGRSLLVTAEPAS
jgi:methyltransferase (TIGR00027 family)